MTDSVVVTGIAGRFGRRVARALHRRLTVVGVDRRPFADWPADVEFHDLDLRSARLRDLFRRPGVRALVHLGVIHDRRHGSEDRHAWNVLGLRQLLDCVEEFAVPKLVLLSSANVYGPRPENPQLLGEEAPLLAAGRFSGIQTLVELDLLVQSFFWRRPGTETVILRPAHILGTLENAPSKYLRLKRAPTLLGFDPMVQVIHQDDVVAAIELGLVPGVRGIFNLAGPPPLALSKALELLGRTRVPLPHGLVEATLDGLFRFGVSSFPAPELDFIRFVCMVDDSRARSVLGYTAGHDLMRTLRAVDDERWPD